MRNIRAKILLIAAMAAVLIPFSGAMAAGDTDVLNKYLAELKAKPDALELRAKIISFVQSMKSTPPTPEDAVRAITRGTAVLNTAKDKEGYERAIFELQEAITAAPWIAEAYQNLAIAQEKAGYYADAIQNLQYCLLVNPRARDAQDIKKKLYELEVYAESAGQTVVPAPDRLPKTAGRKQEQGSAPPRPSERRYDPDKFIGSWYTTQAGRDSDIHVFTLQKNTKGDLVARPPRRVTGTLGSITKFDISGSNLHLQITWKSSSIPGYWKTEDFDLTLSSDGTKLKGQYKLESSGTRDFSDVKEFTKQ